MVTYFLATEELSFLTSEHYFNIQCVKAYLRVTKSESLCMIGLNTYMTRFSSIKWSLDRTLSDVYTVYVGDICNNDFDAPISKAFYIQACENLLGF